MEKRWFWILMIIAALPILIGAVDWLAGYFSRHSTWLVLMGLAILAAMGIFAGIRRLRHRKVASFTLPLMISALFFTVGIAWAGGEVVLTPEHGSLWQLTQECGQPGAAWPAIAAKNPWLKVKMVKGKPVAIVQPGQPIVLPEGWSLVSVSPDDGDEESGVNTTVLAALWVDFCDMAKNYPLLTILLFFVIIAVISARSVADERQKRRELAAAEPETIRSSRHQRGQWESVFLPR